MFYLVYGSTGPRVHKKFFANPLSPRTGLRHDKNPSQRPFKVCAQRGACPRRHYGLRAKHHLGSWRAHYRHRRQVCQRRANHDFACGIRLEEQCRHRCGRPLHRARVARRRAVHGHDQQGRRERKARRHLSTTGGNGGARRQAGPRHAISRNHRGNRPECRLRQIQQHRDGRRHQHQSPGNRRLRLDPAQCAGLRAHRPTRGAERQGAWRAFRCRPE